MYTIQGFGSLYCVAHHVLWCVYIHTSWKSALRASRKSLSNPGENLSDLKVSNSSCSFSNTGPSSSSSFMPSRVRRSYHFNEVFIIFSLAFRLFFFLLNNPLLKFPFSNTCWLGGRSRHLRHLRNHLCHLRLLLRHWLKVYGIYQSLLSFYVNSLN